MNTRQTGILVAATVALTGIAHAAEVESSATVPVTVDNGVQTESDVYLTAMIKPGGLGKPLHRREPASIDLQTVIRLNRDTLYSCRGV